jgi:hypothetical protein
LLLTMMTRHHRREALPASRPVEAAVRRLGIDGRPLHAFGARGGRETKS